MTIAYVSDTSVSVEWKRPWGPFSVYQVKYAVQVTLDSFDQNALNNTRWILDIVDPNQGLFVTYEITGLEAGTYYRLRVVAQTAYNRGYEDGLYSNTIRTKPSFQPHPVQHLRVANVTLDEMTISWDNLLRDNTITGVQVTWSGPGTSGLIELPQGTSDFKISGLQQNEAYKLHVQARNENKQGYEAGIFITGVPETTPPPPLNARLIQFYSDSVELEWEANALIPLPVMYEVQCRVEEDPAADYLLRKFDNCVSGPASSGSSFIAALQIAAPASFALIQGIGQGYTYHFRICAVGSNFQGAIESTCSDYVRVTPSAPPPPSSLAISSVTTSSITLWWAADASTHESWSFIPGKDQPLFDLECPGGTIDDLKAACDAKGGCVGFSTNGCLKSELGFQTSWLPYSAASWAKGECCIAPGQPFGCTAANLDLVPKPACGCECKGLWSKNLQYLLHMSRPPQPFANVEIGGRFGTRISKPSSCASCADCPLRCAQVTGLSTDALYEFRVYTRNLNGVGFGGTSSNVLSAVPTRQPTSAVTDLRLLFTSESRVQLAWTAITSQPVTEYRVLASLDGVDFAPERMAYAVLDSLAHEAGELSAGAGLLKEGVKYWFKVQARNLNSLAYQDVPASNVVTGIPYGTIGPVQELRATESTTCLEMHCCECCRANLCRGIGTVKLVWLAPPGPIVAYQVHVAQVSKAGVRGEFTLAASVTPPTTTCTVTALQVGTDYAFKVVGASTALTEVLRDCTATSPADQICPAMAYASPYPLPATSVQSTLSVLRVTQATITVAWQPIVSEPVTRYQLSYGTNILRPNAFVFAEIDQSKGTMERSIGAINVASEARLTAGLLASLQSYFIYVVPRNLNTGGYATCPKSAHNIAALDLRDGTYTLTWTPPNHTLPITSYRIWHHRNGTSDVLSYAGRYDLITPLAALQYTVSGLEAGKAYQFYVIPSASPCAMIGPILTTNQPNQVANFKLSGSTSTQVEYVWSGSRRYNAYNLSLTYVLSYLPLRTGHVCETHNYTKQVRIASTINTYAFTALNTMQPYCFRIFAENNHDQKSGAASYDQGKAMPLPYAAPHAVSQASRYNLPGVLKGASILLRWVQPDIDRYFFPLAGEISFYKVGYWKRSDKTCLQKVVHINCLSYQEHPQKFLTTSGNVTNLDPATAYYFKVYSGNPSGFELDGSVPVGPILTSNLPGPVLGLKIAGVTASSVTLSWDLHATLPTPSKLKLAYTEHATAKQVFEELSCMPPASACPSTKTWSGLTTAFNYTFEVFSGGAHDTMLPIRFEQAYTGVARFMGGPYKATNSPRNLTLLSWSDSGVRVTFKEPEAHPLNGPVLDYFLQGSINGASWTSTSIGPRLSAVAARQILDVESIGGTPLNFQGLYSLRVFTTNLCGNSTSDLLANLSIYPRPSQVPSLVTNPQPAPHTLPAYNLQWAAPVQGASADTGFEYVVQVSDDLGASFFTDIGSPFQLAATSTTIHFVNRPRPVKIEEGRTYLTRITPKNLNVGAHITRVPAKTLLTYTTPPPGPVHSMRVESLTDTTAVVSWGAPYMSAHLSFSDAYEVEYDCEMGVYSSEMGVYSRQPTFWPLNGTFANLKETAIVMTVSEVRQGLSRAGATLSPSATRFVMRIIPRNAGGASQLKNPSMQVWFVDGRKGKVQEVRIHELRNTSARVTWTFPNTTVALVAIDILTSTDGLRFEHKQLLASSYVDHSGVVQQRSSTTLEALAGGAHWIQVQLISESGVSIAYHLLGPTLIDSWLQPVMHLRVVWVTATSVLLTWQQPATWLVGWQVSYTRGDDDTQVVGPLSCTSTNLQVTGLQTDVQYHFLVTTPSEAGLRLASKVSATTMKAALGVTKLQAVPFDAAGNLRLAWLPSPSVYAQRFRVSLDEENRDGNIGVMRLAAPPSKQRMLTITGLQANQAYRFQVQSANAHERGFGSGTLLHYTIPSKPAAPTAVIVAFSLNEGLIVKWIKATSGGATSYFKIVTLTPTGAQLNQQVIQYHNAQTLMAEIQGLEATKLYSITLSACNLAGCTPAAAIPNQRTAPSQPLELTTSSITDSAIRLQWSHPAPTNATYKYYIKYRQVTTQPTSTSIIQGRLVLGGGGGFVTTFNEWGAEALSDSGGAASTYTIAGLLKNTKYQIALYVEFESIRGAPVFMMGMPADAPQAVEQFGIADDAHMGVLRNSLTIMWRAPAGSTLTHYDLFYWSKADVSKRTYVKIGAFEANQRPDGTGNNYYSIANLQTYQEYGFEIITRNLNTGGVANPNIMTMCSAQANTLCTSTLPTPVPQPGRVQNLRMTASTVDSVTLKWELPPSADDSFLTHMSFSVSYTTVSSNSFVAFAQIATSQVTIHNLSNLAGSGIEYYFRIRARNSNSQGYGKGKSVTGMPNNVCPVTACLVRNLRVVAYSGSAHIVGQTVSLAWDPPSEFDAQPSLRFYYKVIVGGSQQGPEIYHDSPFFVDNLPLNLGASRIYSVLARTLNPGHPTTTNLGFGGAKTVTATPKAQPAALSSPPSLSGVSPNSVTLSWTGPTSYASEHSYKVAWRLAGTNAGFSNPSYSSTTSAVVTGLTFTQSYDFKVFTRNLNADGFEGFGSPVFTGRPRATLGPPPDFKIASITETSVTMSWQAHEGISNAQYQLTFASSHANTPNTTEVNSIDVFSFTKTALSLGTTYHFSLRVKDLGGWSDIGYRVARTITRASAVRSLTSFAIDSDDAGLSWQAPVDLGSPVLGLSIWGYTVDLSQGSIWVNLGTSKSLRFYHANVSAKGVTYTYRVAVLVQQSSEFGYHLNPGTYSQVILNFGTAPIFVGATPPDKTTIIAQQSRIVYIPLEAYSWDVSPSNIAFSSTGALPSVVVLSPRIPMINATSKTAIQNLAITFVPDLAGSEFYLCMQAQDTTNGLRTQPRCYTILLPLAAPEWLAPPHNSAFEARVGCTLTVGFVVEDRTTSLLDPEFAAQGGFIPQVVLLTMLTESNYKSTVSAILPAGAALVTSDTLVLNPASTNLVWRLRKGQEGFAYRLCFSTATANNADNVLCLSVTTARCQYCSKPEDSVQRVAKEWHTTWTQVWSGNHILDNPDMLMTEQIVQVGPIYTVQKDEDLDHIALRYGVDLDDLLLWNPDVADTCAQELHYVIRELQELCVIPQSCIYTGSISSAPTFSHAAF